MWTTIFSAGLLSIDSLVVSMALSPLLRSSRQRWLLAALFGICDAAAAAIGVANHFRFAHEVAPVFALVCGLYCLVAAVWKKFRADLRLAFLLPVLMSLDNLAYGIESGPLSGSLATRAAVLGFASFSLAGLGLYAGSRLQFSGLRASQSFAGFALFSAGLFLLFN